MKGRAEEEKAFFFHANLFVAGLRVRSPPCTLRCDGYE